MKGQLNMFDLFSSMDSLEPGEVEMVSLVPDFDEPEVEESQEPEESPEVEESPAVEEQLEVVEEPAVEEEPEVIEEPVVEEEPEIVVEPEPVMEIRQDSGEKVAMSRVYELDGKRIEIAYINYNKVRITRGDASPVIKEFASTKEAVDYYVEQMQELEIDE